MQRPSVLRVYRELLRLERRWPAEPDRPGRNVKDALAREVRAQFRQNAHRTDPTQVSILLEAAQADAAALAAVLEDAVKRQYPRAPELDRLAEVPFDRRQILSTEAQTVLQKPPPFWARLLPRGRS